MNSIARRAAILLLAGLMASSAAAQPGGGPSPVEAVRATLEQVAPELELPGTAAPIQRSRVASTGGGIVVERQAFFGQKKKKGDLLVRLDSVKAQARVAAARAQAQEAKARLDLLAAGERPETIEARRAELARSRSNHGDAARDWERIRGLFARRAVSEHERDRAQARLEAEKAGLEVAQANLRLSERGSRTEEIAAQKAAWERSTAQLAEAEKELDETMLRAPFDGWVAEVLVEVGDHVSEGGAILELVDLSYLDVVVLVPEARAAQVPRRQVVQLDFSSGGATRTVTGIVAAVGPQATLKGRTVPVVVRMRNPGENLRSGASAQVRLPVGPRETRLVISKDAIVRSASAPPSVYVVEGGKAAPRTVRLGLEAGEKVTVLSGVAAGELVVVRGNERLRPGAAVQVTTGPAQDGRGQP
ncbi:MAG: efflux RND transporter periplasmic adaptor subunit [Candidatus Wallbacteria bacterium]|nr:efflux RND transporter periplasmic adaptor subunit [Candidatus Wallbacteria bacterium]